MFSIVLMLAAGSVVQQSDAAFPRFQGELAALLTGETTAEALVVPPVRVRGGVPRMREVAPSMGRRAAIGTAVLAASAPAFAEDNKDKEATAEAPTPAAQETDKKPKAKAPAKDMYGKSFVGDSVTLKDFKAKGPEGLGALSKGELKKQEAARKEGKVLVPTTDSDGRPFLEGEEARAIIGRSGARTFNDLAEGPQSGGGWRDDLAAKRRLTERLVEQRAALKEKQR